jgi:glutamate/tyrosine decarboxylase-like PLP-dependent enzyme
MSVSKRTGLTEIEMSPDAFKKAGYQLVDQLADFINSFDNRPLTRDKLPSEIKFLMGDGPLPTQGSSDVNQLLSEATKLLTENSLFNSHPMFFGYITSTPTPIGILSDMLASAINPYVGAGILSPVATEIELQSIRWMAEFIGYPTDCAGVMVSGGNMANFLGFLTARKAKSTWDVLKE